MHLEAGVPEPHLVEAALDDVEGGALLRDEQDRLPAGEGIGDQVRDRLGLPGARWPLDHEVTAGADVQQGRHLRAVAVLDRQDLLRPGQVVEEGVFRRGGGRVREAVAEDPGEQRMLEGALSCGPLKGSQVLEHGVAREREEPEGQLVGDDLPAVAALHGSGQQPGDLGRVARLVTSGGRQADAELGLELGDEGRILFELVPRVADAVPVVRDPFEGHGYQQEGRPARLLAARGFIPVQHSDGEEEHVEALLLERGARIAAHELEVVGEALRSEVAPEHVKRAFLWGGPFRDGGCPGGRLAILRFRFQHEPPRFRHEGVHDRRTRRRDERDAPGLQVPEGDERVADPEVQQVLAVLAQGRREGDVGVG